jgi:hypothetical protein
MSIDWKGKKKKEKKKKKRKRKKTRSETQKRTYPLEKVLFLLTRAVVP